MGESVLLLLFVQLSTPAWCVSVAVGERRWACGRSRVRLLFVLGGKGGGMALRMGGLEF